MQNSQKHYTLSIMVHDTPGVLSQVARLFSRKGYNIESIASGATQDAGITRITIVLLGTLSTMNQLAAQCRKLIPVVAVKILDSDSAIEREVCMIKVSATDRGTRDEIIQIANIFRANIIDISRTTLTVAVFGEDEKLKALIELLGDFGVLEIVRTGTVALERGQRTIYDDNKLNAEYDYGKTVY